MSYQDDLDTCRALLGAGSRTFQAASWLMPRGVCDAACALYAFCRLADDEVDGDGHPETAVAALRIRLATIYGTHALGEPVDRAMRHVVRAHAIPNALPLALLEGFEWDAAGRRYETVADLHGYAARVAGSVGAMMALLMGVRDRAALARACDLGVAMQLSNIARDVGEDARRGRLYLPLQWMREAGLDPDAWLARPRFGPALAEVVNRLLSEAEILYRRVDRGMGAVPPSCRPGINAARLLYRQIGMQVARRGFNSVDSRAVVHPLRKALWLARAVVHWPPARDRSPPEPLAATLFLVDAVAARASGTAVDRSVPWWRLHARAVALIELLERVERRRRARAPALGDAT